MSRYHGGDEGDEGPPSSKRGKMDVMLSPTEVLRELQKVNMDLPENKILIITVINAAYPINVKTIHRVFKEHGEIDRIVIFDKGTFVQSLVEFKEVASATAAKNNLHGCDIYNNACTLKIEYARQQRLNVKKNDEMTWDFNEPEDFGQIKDMPNIERKVLLKEELVDALGKEGSTVVRASMGSVGL